MSFTTRDLEIAMSDFDWSDMGDSPDYAPFAIVLNGKPTVIFKMGSDLSSGDVWVVFSIYEPGGRLFRKTGYYESEDGTYWDGSIREVQAKSKTITVYEPIKL